MLNLRTLNHDDLCFTFFCRNLIKIVPTFQSFEIRIHFSSFFLHSPVTPTHRVIRTTRETHNNAHVQLRFIWRDFCAWISFRAPHSLPPYAMLCQVFNWIQLRSRKSWVNAGESNSRPFRWWSGTMQYIWLISIKNRPINFRRSDAATQWSSIAVLLRAHFTLQWSRFGKA